MSSSMAEEYPRRDFERSCINWKSLNGLWDFRFDDKDVGLAEQWHKKSCKAAIGGEDEPQKIRVPFVFQCEASGINDQGVHEVLWYERTIPDIRTDEQRRIGHRLIVRFGAVDYVAKVWVDRQFVGQHQGGHVPFDFDITETLGEGLTSNNEFRLTVRVFDSAYDLTQPRGKQYWGPKPQSIYYTPSGGIWQSVWLESVPSTRVGDSSHGTILRSNDIEGGKLDTRIAVVGRRVGHQCSVELEASLAGVVVNKSERKQLPKDKDFVRFNHNLRLSDEQIKRLPEAFIQTTPMTDDTCWRDGLALWSPEHPTLYDLAIRLYDADGELLDNINTTTGMRSISWTAGDGSLRLNGKPYFQALLLDQGYWPRTLMTPPTSSDLRKDIELSKAMGFNGCRKHQKVEDPMFMYWADRLGFLVWGEMASAYQFSVDYMERFDQEWKDMVKRDMNHPCVVAWTIANESWGYPDLQNNTRQRDHLRSLYHTTKALDPTRPINDNCGWEHVLTDLSTFHDYADAPGMAERCKSVQSVMERGANMFVKPVYNADGAHDEGSRHQRGAPVLCTEFGGVNISASKDETQTKNWGYTTAKDSQDLMTRVENIVMATVKSGIVCGFVWTQTTDIEQEQNGLYTWDRQPKIPADQMTAVISRATKWYHTNRR